MFECVDGDARPFRQCSLDTPHLQLLHDRLQLREVLCVHRIDIGDEHVFIVLGFVTLLSECLLFDLAQAAVVADVLAASQVDSALHTPGHQGGLEKVEGFRGVVRLMLDQAIVAGEGAAAGGVTLKQV